METLAQLTGTQSPFPGLSDQLAQIEKIKTAIAEFAEQVSNLVVGDADSRDAAQTLAQQSKMILKRVEDKRVEIKSPYLEASKLIDETAKRISSSLKSADDVLRSRILAYDMEIERQKEAERQRIEAERREREEAERREVARVNGLKARIQAIVDWAVNGIDKARTAEELDKVFQGLEEAKAKRSAFDEFADEATKQFDYLQELATARFDAIDEMQKADEARRAELQRIEDERIEAERKRANEARERREREEQEAAAQRELQSEIRAAETYIETKKVDATKTSIAKRWTYEIVDAAQLPAAYMMPDARKIAEAVKEGVREIPGIRIFQSANVVIR